MMLNLDRLEWDPAMLEMLGVPAAMLPTPGQLARSDRRGRARHPMQPRDSDRRRDR